MNNASDNTGSEAKKSHNQKKGGFWNTLPGVLTQVAAIITALGVLVGALSQLSSSFRNETSPLHSSSINSPKVALNASESLNSESRQIALKDFKNIASGYKMEPEKRRVADAKIRELAKNLTLEDIQPYSRDSRQLKMRVCAGVALAGLLAASPSLIDSQYTRLADIVDYGLNDEESTVRFRYVTVLEENLKLAEHFKTKLQKISRTDSNKPTRDKASKALRRLE